MQNVRDGLGLRRGASVQLGPITVPTSVEEVQRPFRQLASQLGLTKGISGSAVQVGPLSFPTSLDEVQQPFRKLAGQLGLTTREVSGSAVQLGPVSIPTTRAEWRRSLEGLQQQVGLGGPAAETAVGAQMSYRGDPRFLERLRSSWENYRSRFTGMQVGQAGALKNAGWVLLVILIAVAIAAVINRVTLTRKLKELGKNIQQQMKRE
jgi:hypothetical protein